MGGETKRLVEARPRKPLNARVEAGKPWSIFEQMSGIIKIVL